MGWFLKRVTVGLLVSFFVVALFAGGLTGAIAVMAVSIICTAGIGLVVWVPVWWITGFMVLDVICVSLGIIDPPESNDESLQSPSRGDETGKPSESRALKAYIRQALASGMDATEIKHRLEQNGWQPPDIERAYQRVVEAQRKTGER